MVRLQLVAAAVLVVLASTNAPVSAERCGVKKDRDLTNAAIQKPLLPGVENPTSASAPEPTTENPAIQKPLLPGVENPTSGAGTEPTTANPAIQKPLLPGVENPASGAGSDEKPATVAPPAEPAASTAAPAPTPAPTPAPAPGLANWVGPLVGKPIDSACYRKTYVTTNKQCGAGYNYDNVLTCWTQCPIEYPVECGMECIQQNKDCTKQILKKVTSVVNVALNAATGGVFGSLTKAGKGIQTGIKCGHQLFSVTKKIVALVEQIEGGAASTPKDQVLLAINKSDFVLYDLPAAVATCVGVPIPSGLNKAKEVTGVVQKVVNTVVNGKLSGLNLLDFKTFLNVTKSSVPSAVASIGSLSSADTSSLMTLVSSGATCGMDINAVVNRIIAMVQDMKNKDATTPVDVLKTAVLNSNFVLQDLPKASSSCATTTKGFSSREASTTGFPSRDQIIKTVHVMIDSIVGASNKDDKPQSTAEFGISVANMGLDAIALIDPTGIAAMASEFVQPICGPTTYVGQIDDGPADQALGLNMIQKAFRGSTGSWKKKGDGQLRLTFKSVDDKDVRVNVISGGKKKYEVKVKKGQTVEWSKPLSEFQGKTLYLDRWRGGILNIPGTGGGSLLCWVPDNKDGELTLAVQINPTSFKDKDRRLRN